MKKRGLSSVVTTLFLILIVLVAVGLIWVVVSVFLDEGLGEVSLDRFDLGDEDENIFESGEGWLETYEIDSLSFESGFTGELAEQERFEITIDGQTHYVAVIEVTDTDATIKVYSEPISFTLLEGQEKNVDATKDGNEDIYIKLNSVYNDKANLTIKKIGEEIYAYQYVDGEKLCLPVDMEKYNNPNLGDVNEDGVVDNADSQNVLNYWSKNPVEGVFNENNADVDLNNMIDNADSQIILNHFAKLPGFETLPAINECEPSPTKYYGYIVNYDGKYLDGDLSYLNENSQPESIRLVSLNNYILNGVSSDEILSPISLSLDLPKDSLSNFYRVIINQDGTKVQDFLISKYGPPG